MKDFIRTVLDKIDAQIPLDNKELEKLTVYITNSWKKPDSEIYQGFVKLFGRFFLIEYKKSKISFTDISQPIEINPTSPVDIYIYVKKQQEFVSKDGKITLPLEDVKAFCGQLLLKSDIDYRNFFNYLNTGLWER